MNNTHQHRSSTQGRQCCPESEINAMPTDDMVLSAHLEPRLVASGGHLYRLDPSTGRLDRFDQETGQLESFVNLLPYRHGRRTHELIC